MVIIYMPAAYAPTAVRSFQAPHKRIAPVAFASQASRRHDGLALEVLGKFREIFRSASCPGAASAPPG
jgi:hypothetical protein